MKRTIAILKIASKLNFKFLVRVWGLVFKDLPFVKDDTLFTKELYDSYSMQKVTFCIAFGVWRLQAV